MMEMGSSKMSRMDERVLVESWCGGLEWNQWIRKKKLDLGLRVVLTAKTWMMGCFLLGSGI